MLTNFGYVPPALKPKIDLVARPAKNPYIPFERYHAMQREKKAKQVGELFPLLGEVAAAHNVTTDQLRGRSRKAHIVKARRDFCMRARALNVYSYPVIGEVLCRHHTSILHLAGATNG